MKMLNTPADWIGQIHFTGLPLLSSEELKEAQKSLMKAYVDTQHILDQPGKNHDGYGYKYADLNDVISSIQAATKDLDIAYIQQPVTHGGQTGIHNYLINSQGAILDFGSYLIDLGKPSPQEHGKCLTYVRRYSISSIFGIASEDDTDAKEFEGKEDFLSPSELSGIKVVYQQKKRDLVEVIAMAMAGDELAKQIIADKDNPVKTKLAIKSITKMYKFSEDLIDKKSTAKEKLVTAEKKEQEAKKQEQINQQAAKVIDPPYTESSEFKKLSNEVNKSDPFDEAMKKVR